MRRSPTQTPELVEPRSITMDSGLRRRDTTKGTPLRVLSLDGGGVRGYSMLILLHDFMHKVYTECHDGEPPEPDKIPRPCEYFDLIGGTGTGGLIAIMLGRLRMNTRDCMRVYVQMTRKVFETDKTIAGIPYRSTLFKASLLEDAIRSCVRKFDQEADVTLDDRDMPMTPASFDRPSSVLNGQGLDRSLSTATTASRAPTYSSGAFAALGNPNALLEDQRQEKRCKTAVTAVLKGGSEKTGTTILLRSYPSRTQSAVEPECTIWQAGRATCATKLAFKEIRVGTSTFLDEGYGLLNSDRTPTYNPAPQILEEAIINEWPGQPIGLLCSIGTGKRPGNSQHMQQEWWEGFAGGLGNFAEAKRKLIAKIEGCEKTHQEMLSVHLPRRSINPDNYLRLNVEVGVGEFGMNEWNRLADISNNTQAYLNTPSVKSMLINGAMQMAKVEQQRRATAQKVQAANERYERLSFEQPIQSPQHHQQQQQQQTPYSAHPPDPFAVELPSNDYPAPLHPHHNQQHHQQARPQNQQYPPQQQRPVTYPSTNPQQISDEKYTLVTSDEYPQPLQPHQDDYKHTYNPDPNAGQHPLSAGAAEAPPLPPKTPIQHLQAQQAGPRRYASHPLHQGQIPGQGQWQGQGQGGGRPPLPYPDNDGPPPAVNMSRKPEYVPR